MGNVAGGADLFRRRRKPAQPEPQPADTFDADDVKAGTVRRGEVLYAASRRNAAARKALKGSPAPLADPLGVQPGADGTDLGGDAA